MIALELLDNLPHDKLTFNPQSGGFYESVVSVEGGMEVEHRRPLQDEFILRHLHALALQGNVVNDPKFDYKRLSTSPISHEMANLLRFRPPPPLIQRMMQSITSAFPRLDPRLLEVFYIPTGSHKLLQVLSRFFPNHGLLLADFNSLEETMPGHNAPLIQATKGMDTEVKATYLNTEMGAYDILFPTNFRYLTALHAAVTHRPSSVVPQVDFLQKYCPTLNQTRTRSGYNPLLSDFINTSVLVSHVL